VHRRGQKKDVHVYYFLAARTMDANILKDREGKTLVQRGGKYLLLAESEIEEGDKRDLAGAPFEGAACSMRIDSWYEDWNIKRWNGHLNATTLRIATLAWMLSSKRTLVIEEISTSRNLHLLG
jgi:hypothetical protein